MKFQNFAKLSLLATATLFSCSSDDDSVDTGGQGGVELIRAEGNSSLFVYSFENEEGVSTVNFAGQTTRLLQGEELLSELRSVGDANIDVLNLMYGGSEGQSAGFENEALNGTTRLLRSKTAASISYFGENTAESSEIRTVFDGYITEEYNNFLSVFSSPEEALADFPAGPGQAGAILDEGSIRLVNEGGLEVNQAFNKGLIGAIMGDQIMNHYLFLAQDEQGRIDNANGVLDEDNPYTAIAHYWDEAYGYAFGNPGTDEAEADSFLYKYIDRVNEDADFSTIKDDIQIAFITGRQAIVDVDYDEVDAQIEILQELISEVIAIRAVFYLQTGQDQLRNEDETGNAFHDLSEGFGFITSLRYTRNPETNLPYIEPGTVNQFAAELQEGFGFWDLIDELENPDTETTLDRISRLIAAEFDFTVEQAGSLLAAE